MDVLRQDLRFALRLLLKDKAFALTTILTLAICIGANSAIFTVVQSVLLRPLPYPDSDRIVMITDGFPGAGVERAGTSVPNFYDRAAMTDVFDSVAIYQHSGYGVGEGTGAEGVPGLVVSPSFFTVLRTSAVRGRVFQPGDGEVGHEHVALFSYGFAKRQPGGVDAQVGRQVHLNHIVYEVVGVLPEGFTFLDPKKAVFVPTAFKPDERGEDRRYSQNHEAIARLAPGATVAQAAARIDAMNQHQIEQAGPLKEALKNAGYHTLVLPLGADLVRNISAALRLLWGGVILVLLIAGVNITNLSLVRATSRIKELATRHALGAARSRVTRQLVTETLVLTVIGGLAGLALGYWSLDALTWLGLSDIPRAYEIHMDGTVIAFTLTLAVLLGLIVGAVPALQLAGVNLNAVLREEGRSGTAGRGSRHARQGLVVSQVALAFVLLIGAGLLLTSFRQLLQVDPGFRAEQVLTGRVSPLESRYPDDKALRSYTARVLDRLRALPGVEATGISSFLPFSWDGSSSVIMAEGYAMAPGESVVSPNQLYVSPGYLETMRVPLKAGRYFADADNESAPRVVIVDERLAKKFWPAGNAVGHRMYLPDSPEDVVKPGPKVTWLQVVGVVGNVKLKGLEEGENARVGAYYMPAAQNPPRNIGIALRARGNADLATLTGSVNRALAEIDPELQMFDTFAMSQRVEQSLNPRRAPMLLSLAFGVVALLLASVGIYGVLAYQVSQRTREIGIRMALGGDTRSILQLVLREGIILVGIGLAGGFAGALALKSVIASQLYGVGALDPFVMLGVTTVLAVASLVACVGPARRAAKVSPVVALTGQ